METANAALGLLKFESVPVLYEAPELFCCLSNVNNVVSVLLEQGVHMQAVQFLGIEPLRKPAIAFIGNLANGEASKVKEMIDAGLVQMLFSFLESEYTADVLLVLSNLVETIPDELVAIVTPQMVKVVVEIAQVASYDIRRECAFFMATLIWYMNPSVLGPLITVEVMEELSEMCSCGDSKIVLRCLGAIMRVYHLSRANDKISEFTEIMEAADVARRVEELIEDNNPEVIRSARALQSVFDKI